jgi:hypothetical protein
MPHIRHILTHIVLYINQRAIRNCSNQAVGTGNKQFYYFASSFLPFILLLRFSPSTSLGFLVLLPPTFSLPCCRLLIIETPSYRNVPATKILTFRQNIDFVCLFYFLESNTFTYTCVMVALLKVAYYRRRPGLILLGPFQVDEPYFDFSVTDCWLSNNA